VDEDGDFIIDSEERDMGTSPYMYNRGWADYVGEFGIGFVKGDYIREAETVPMLIGQIVGSFVPGADFRDIKANWDYKDYEMLLLNVAGLIPIGGDIPKATKAIGEFSQKNADKLDEVADLLNIINKNMPDVKKGLAKSDEFVEAVQKLTKVDTAKLTRAQAEAVRDVLSTPELQRE